MQLCQYQDDDHGCQLTPPIGRTFTSFTSAISDITIARVPFPLRTQSPSPAQTSPQTASASSADPRPASCPKSANTNRHPSSKSQSASRPSDNPSRTSGSCSSPRHPDSESGTPHRAPILQSWPSTDSPATPPSKCAAQPRTKRSPPPNRSPRFPARPQALSPRICFAMAFSLLSHRRSRT